MIRANVVIEPDAQWMPTTSQQVLQLAKEVARTILVYDDICCMCVWECFTLRSVIMSILPTLQTPALMTNDYEICRHADEQKQYILRSFIWNFPLCTCWKANIVVQRSKERSPIGRMSRSFTALSAAKCDLAVTPNLELSPATVKWTVTSSGFH